MSGLTRALRSDELDRFWPAVRQAHLMGALEDLKAFHEADAWRVRASERGDVMLLAPWRAHLDVLAIRGVWAPPQRIGALVSDAVAVARAQGFGSVISPVLAESATPPYREGGMATLARLVAFVAICRDLHAAGRLPEGARIRSAGLADVSRLVALDGASFDEFWRNGEPEVREDLQTGRVLVAEAADGAILGYASANRYGASATLGRLAVSEGARRQGIARALIQAVAAWAEDAGALGLSLCTQEENTASRRLYRAVGFDEVGERYIVLRSDV